MKSYLFIPIIICFLTPLFGQKYSNEFLAIGAGARAQGMGNAAIVTTQDAYSNYWNPAGIANVESKLQFAFMHAEWFAGIGKYDYLSAVYPIWNKNKDVKRSLGISIIRFGVDDIPNTLSLYEDDGTINYDNIVPFSAADYAFLFTYAQSIWVGDNADLFVGGNAKVIYRKIGPFANAKGFGFDLGLQYKRKHWSLGLSAKDVTNTFNAWSFDFTDEQKEDLDITSNDIPISSLEVTRPWFVVGGAYHQRFGKFGILAELDMIMTTDGRRNTLLAGDGVSFDPAFGLELDYKETIYLRGGVNNFQEETNINQETNLTMAPTLGIGLKFYALSLDYAFTDISNTEQKTYSHVVSLLLDIDFKYFKKKSKQ